MDRVSDSRISCCRLIVVAIIAAIASLGARPVYAATLTVTNTNDSGAGSLRNAITVANSDSGDTINFNIPGGGPFIITLASTLPAVASSMTISGPVSSPPRIIVNGNQAVQLMLVSAGATLSLKYLALSNAKLLGQPGDQSGAAIFNQGALNVANCTFSGNVASGGSDASGGVLGGAISSIGPSVSLTVVNSTFTNNQAAGFNSAVGGGGTALGGAIGGTGFVSISGSTFLNNQALGGTGLSAGQPGGSAVGGGVFTSGGQSTAIVNSTFFGNQATGGAGNGGDGESLGSAISVQGGPGTITSSTLVGNVVNGPRPLGGALDAEGIPVTLKSTILAANAPSDCFGNATDGGYNVADDTSCSFTPMGTSQVASASAIGVASVPADNGGPTKTIALAPGGLAVDAIPLADCTDQSSPTPQPIVTDQRGLPRPDPGNNPPVCDIGAYELQDSVAFAKFAVQAVIHRPDDFLVLGTFTLASSSMIDPLTQAVTLTVGAASPVTIPAGSFKKSTKGVYVFSGTVGGVLVAAAITPLAKNAYGFSIAGDGLYLAGIINPVTVMLQIGNATGSQKIKALTF
jgi:hypothetical protein